MAYCNIMLYLLYRNCWILILYYHYIQSYRISFHHQYYEVHVIFFIIHNAKLIVLNDIFLLVHTTFDQVLKRDSSFKPSILYDVVKIWFVGTTFNYILSPTKLFMSFMGIKAAKVPSDWSMRNPSSCVKLSVRHFLSIPCSN